jgi:hypothetical protein
LHQAAASALEILESSHFFKNLTYHFVIQIYAVRRDRNSSSRFAMAPAGDKSSIA